MLVLFCRDLTGGIRKHIVSILVSYRDNPSRVKLVTQLSAADSGFRKFLRDNPKFKDSIVDIDIRRSPHPADLSMLWKVKGRLQGLPTNSVFHGHGAKGGLMARFLGLVMGRPCVYTPHGGSIHPMFSKVKNLIYALVEKALYPLTDRLVFESRYSLETYSSRIHSRTNKFFLNYNGVSSISGAMQRTPSGGPLIIGAFGALRPLKGFDVLAKAAAILKDQGHQFELRIYGEGPERDKLSQFAVVKLMGETDRVEDAMLECDIVVQPSRFESFGLTACEAMALGIPVIVSDAGGLPEVVDDQASGLVFKSEDVADLEEKLGRLLKSEDLRNSFSQAGPIRVSQLFDESKMIQNLKGIYLELAGAPGET